MIVMKFGGSSVESAAAIDRVAAIVKSRLARRPVVVVSAMGKTTNRLLAIARHAVEGNRAAARADLEALKQYTLAEGGPVGGAVDAHFHELAELVQGLAVLGELTPRSIDAISAYGERLSSLIVAERFRAAGLDAVQADSREYVVTDARHTQAAPLYPETYERLAKRLAPVARDRVVVMGGFIGATAAGVTTTLGRGGSDFSAAIIGAGLDADEIQIWTDVDGMLTCDPRIANVGHRVKVISFGEAAELAYFGAKVLHPSTVLPAVEKNIPVLILNSRRPEVEGTRIVAETVACRNAFKAIACKQGIVSVHIRSLRMLMAHGFLRRIFEVFDRYATPVDMVTTSEVSVSLTIDTVQNLDPILTELREFAEVTVEQDQAIVCMVGDNIGATRGIAGRVFQAMNGINIRMISQGASNLNLSFAIAGRDLTHAVELLHHAFFSDLDPAVFDPERSAA
ncbi:MAG: lysine-sensitive aspartokinase 3 [Bryobacterales bacterium]|nr:lysine-sensitive aspartokinase 3 [Bryobacterales bacterium]